MSSIPQPELYWTKPNPHCPNSKLPVLVYRQVLPADRTVESVRKALEPNQWIEGGVFKHYPTAHFHSNTHECYAALKGSTKWSLPNQTVINADVPNRSLYGVGPLDDQSEGVAFSMTAGDIAVHAAGVAHRNTESSPDYEYAGLYPKGAPHWDNNFCKADLETTSSKAASAGEVPIPDCDPIYGYDGPLPRIWKGVMSGVSE